VAIAHQPAMRPEPVSTRPALPRNRHALAPVDLPPRGWTGAHIVGLLAGTALCMALAAAVVAGSVLFAILNFGG
jgi:hypothetical protein